MEKRCKRSTVHAVRRRSAAQAASQQQQPQLQPQQLQPCSCRQKSAVGSPALCTPPLCCAPGHDEADGDVRLRREVIHLVRLRTRGHGEDDGGVNWADRRTPGEEQRGKWRGRGERCLLGVGVEGGAWARLDLPHQMRNRRGIDQVPCG